MKDKERGNLMVAPPEIASVVLLGRTPRKDERGCHCCNKIEIVYKPHPLYPPLLTKESGKYRF